MTVFRTATLPTFFFAIHAGAKELSNFLIYCMYISTVDFNFKLSISFRRMWRFKAKYRAFLSSTERVLSLWFTMQSGDRSLCFFHRLNNLLFIFYNLFQKFD